MEEPKFTQLPSAGSFERDSSYSVESSPRSVNGSSLDSPLRVMQFNIHGWRDTYHKDNFGEILHHVQACSPDVLVLNEVLHPYGPMPDEYFDTVKAGKGNGYTAEPLNDKESYLQRLADATGLRSFVFGQAVEDGYFGLFGYGNAILSKFDLSDSTHTVLKANSFEYQSDRRIEAEDRCVSSAVINHSTKLRVFTSHLDQLDEQLRHQQIERILAQLARSEEPCMLMGDLNTYQASDFSAAQWKDLSDMWARKNWGEPPKKSATMEALTEHRLKDAHYLCERNAGRFAKPTCWTIEPLFRIDYAMLDEQAAKQWQVLQCDRMEQVTCSDHFPIMLDLAATTAQ
eukprot:TRINITY_DN20272_c0_g1_i1.p1 TRINITY_DN20272_c0_g1~~TRINITY_DN20272_c0_g1_i1.p1  ORF type:complete len:343 (+),score=82.44 TRINITY_DN20272_c0_g1_i1:111-1139(+)